MKKVWNWLTDWFENGDLVPLLIVVSAWHYASILSSKDAWIVAVCIGILVDIGHFRTIRAAFRYQPVKGKGVKKPGEHANILTWIDYRWNKTARRFGGQTIARWSIALIMTGISLAYHQRYYNDFWLSAPIPFLIASLAWLQKVDLRKKAITKQNDATPAQQDATPIAEISNRERALLLHAQYPEMTQAEIAQQLKVSRQRVGVYLSPKQMAVSPAEIHNNGKGG